MVGVVVVVSMLVEAVVVVLATSLVESTDSEKIGFLTCFIGVTIVSDIFSGVTFVGVTVIGGTVVVVVVFS